MERYLRYEYGRDGTNVAGIMRYSLSYRLTVAGGLCALIAGMAAIDTDVRKELVGIMSGRGRSSEIASIGWHVHDFAVVAFRAMKEQGMENAVMVGFGIAATVLVLFMLRTRL
jgi:hypothetical protein